MLRHSPRRRERSPQCDKEKTTANVDDVVFRSPSADEPEILQTGFSCYLPCSYELRVLDATTGEPVATASGKAVGAATVKIPAAGLPPGQYEYALRAFKCGKPGTAETRFSTPFALGAADVKSRTSCRRSSRSSRDRAFVAVAAAVAVVADRLVFGRRRRKRPRSTRTSPRSSRRPRTRPEASRRCA